MWSYFNNRDQGRAQSFNFFGFFKHISRYTYLKWTLAKNQCMLAGKVMFTMTVQTLFKSMDCLVIGSVYKITHRLVPYTLYDTLFSFRSTFTLCAHRSRTQHNTHLACSLFDILLRMLILLLSIEELNLCFHKLVSGELHTWIYIGDLPLPRFEQFANGTDIP